MSASDHFARAVEFVLSHEGGLSQDPRDPGGTTKYGISQRAYPDVDIRALTKNEAIAIYHRDYWAKLRCHEMPWPINLVLFDSAVNSGRRKAGAWLQACYNRVASDHLVVDGAIGPVTAWAIYSLGDGTAGRSLALAMIVRRLRFYAALAKQEHHKSHLRGWLLRCCDLAELASQKRR